MSHPLQGCWLIKSCTVQGNKSDEDSGLEGLKFILNNTGDVTWITEKNDSKGIPLLSCETYTTHKTNLGTIIRFGAYAEHIIEFKVEPKELQDDLTLDCEGWCTLNCIRYNNVDPNCFPVEEYNFLSAVEEGFFSDITIEAQDRKQFHVHSTILGLLGNDISWFSQPPPFTGLPEGVVGTIIHWLYTECLPNAMTEDIAVQVIDAVKCYPSMSKLVENCKTYLKNMDLKQQIVDLVCDIHMCTNHIIEYFNEPGESLGENPAKLCLVIKQSAKESAIALLKVILLCDLFTKSKTDLTKNDKHEVIKYAHSCLPEFICQLQMLLQVLKITFNSLTPSQRLEIASYLVPEIESGLETISDLIFDLKVAFEQIMQNLMPDQSEQYDNFGEPEHFPLECTLRKVLKVREYSKLKNSHQKVAFTLMHLLQKKECFAEMTQANKVRSVLRNFEQIIDELPIFLLRLEEINSAVDDRIQWREFKFCFKVATSKVYGILSKLIIHQETFKDVIIKLSSLVQREAFSQGLINLGLLESENQSNTTGIHGDREFEHDKYSHSSKPASKKFCNLKLSSSLMRPPTIFQSDLSKASENILENEKFSDMIFEIPITNSLMTKSVSNQLSPENITVSPSSPLIKSTEKTQESKSPSKNTEENTVIIKAHRVIVAARCDWFRRALQSGMKEAIHKRITIHDTSPTLFRRLLCYLYTGKLDTKLTSPEQLTELVLLGDRYELDALKLACEKTLSSKHLDNDNIFYYLNLADQYNAEYLKESCIEIIARHTELVHSDLFAELSPSLQSEVCAVASLRTFIRRTTKPKIHSSEPTEEEQLSFDFSLDLLNDDGSNSECSSVEEIAIDRARFLPCLAHLRDVLGPHVPIEQLNRIALAADYDPNRAINYYYCSNSSDSQDDL